MTWPEAVEMACPKAWGQGPLGAMIAAARAALWDGLPVFAAVVERSPPRRDAGRLGAAMACLGVGLDLQAQALAQGSSGGPSLLLGDGLVTRAMELAAGVGTAALEGLARLAAMVMADATPSIALVRSLDPQGVEALFSQSPVISDGGVG